MSTKQSQREKRLRERRSKDDIPSIDSMNTDEEKQNGKKTQNDAETDKTQREKTAETDERKNKCSNILIEEIKTSATQLAVPMSPDTIDEPEDTIDEPEKENGNVNEVEDIIENDSKSNSENEKKTKECETRSNSDVKIEAEASNSNDNEVTTVEEPLEDITDAWQYKLETPAQCLHALISTSRLSDLTINVKDDEPYKVHRLILSMRSPFWEKKLYTDKFEGDTITLTDEQALPFKHVLTYMYTGKTKFPDVGIAMSVYQLAHKYQMGNLMDICSQFLKSFISTSNVPEVFKCATLLGDTLLLYKCISVMEVSPDAVFTAPTFTSMCRVSVAQLIEQELTVSSEVIVFEALLRWGRSKLESNKEEISSINLRAELLDFLPKVRFLTMTLEEFVKHVMPSGVLSLEEMREIQLNIVNASSDLPSICNPKKEKRKNVNYTCDTVLNKKAKNDDIRSEASGRRLCLSPGPGVVSHQNSITTNSSQQVSTQKVSTQQIPTQQMSTQQAPSQACTSLVTTSASCNPIAEQVSRLSGQAFVQQIPNRVQPTVVTTCQPTQVHNMGNTVVGGVGGPMASRIQQVQQTWTPGGGLTTVSQSASMMRGAPTGAAAFVGLVRTPLGPRLYTMPHHTNFQR